MKKILLTGRNGQVGWELQRTLAPLGKIIALDRQQADLSKTESLVALIREVKPNIIVNAAGYTAVDKAQSERELAFLVNGYAPGILAEEAKHLNALLIHYSTDYVFNGKSTVPYREDSPTSPLNYYGVTKLAGEKAIQESGCRHLILRTSWVYALRGHNFLLTMLKLAMERDHLKIVSDQIGAPTWCRMIAEATAQLIKYGKDQSSDVDGVYNVTCSGSTSWYGFAVAIFDLFAALKKAKGLEYKIPQLSGILTQNYPTPATRPMYSELSHDKVQNTFELYMPHWHEALELCLQEFSC